MIFETLHLQLPSPFHTVKLWQRLCSALRGKLKSLTQLPRGLRAPFQHTPNPFAKTLLGLTTLKKVPSKRNITDVEIVIQTCVWQTRVATCNLCDLQQVA